MPARRLLSVLAGLLLPCAALACTPPLSHPQRAELNRIAAVLGGTGETAPQSHRQALDQRFGRLEQRLFPQLAAFREAHLGSSAGQTVYYPFSGPDLVYLKPLFPDAREWVLTGLEPVGDIPDLGLPPAQLDAALNQLRSSIQNLLRASFFVTAEMQRQFSRHRFTGVTPVLLLFLARQQADIRDMALIELAADGQVCAAGSVDGGGVPGVRFTLQTEAGERQLSYFRMDLSNGGWAAKPGYQAFLDARAPVRGFVKSASFLMHGGEFASVRNWLLGHASLIAQDDSGIPYARFDATQWSLQCVGRYPGPPGSFPRSNQPALVEACAGNAALPFWFGYRKGGHDSHVLVGRRKATE
jgi:hypothetical protein